MSERDTIQTLPLLPIKNTVLFPHLQMPLSIGRPASLAAVEAAMASEEKQIIIVAQRDATIDTPTQDDLYSIGTVAIVKKKTHPRDGMLELVVQGAERAVVLKIEQTTPYFTARVRTLPAPSDGGAEVEALHRAILELAAKALELTQSQATQQLGQLLVNTEDPLRLVYLLGSMLSLDLVKEQSILEAPTRADALRLMHGYLTYEVQVLELRQKIAGQAQSEMSREQREYFLRQQLRAIQQELGEQNSEQTEVALLREQLEKSDLPEEVRKEAERELQRLERLPAASPEHHVVRSYLELVLELPWRKSSESVFDIARARQVLDEDHYDLKEVKERILEHLGVLKLNPEAKAPILCFVGPPGVGKTSLGQSIARALGRNFERMSLGGLHDEAELRGHRRTYIGAMAGRIIQAIRRAGVKNPVLMLDEVDKLGRDFRGDPAAALLEILDPEQNRSFRDNYLDLPFDLSKVLFVTTANTLDTIPQPLRDRMEVLRLAGYSEEEKVEIAKRYLIPRQLKETGLDAEQCQILDEALQRIISRYTREAGVRQLERAIGRLARKTALRIAEGSAEAVTIRAADLPEMLGPEHFFQEQARREQPPGVAAGLAWTEAGGDVLYVEATLLPEGRTLTLTGQLGDVMQESAKAARSYIWSHADELGIDHGQFRRAGVHIHVPAGAIPKDGPSAGITMATALASLYTGCPARNDTAMTGEITLTGLVLPIGGVKEKVLAARRAGILRVILPRENEKDLRELPEHVRAEMEFILVERIEDVLAAAVPRLAERLTAARMA
ncbi:MAG TPA: endopeptidase La [Candidatus Tectomicrobia bacterium]|jgi:ATP-dependent Lon protease|nr:endopeptidase La [Candidatus Tectomicrobia bacterium]